MRKLRKATKIDTKFPPSPASRRGARGEVGFTLVEMIITLAIVSIIATTLLLSRSNNSDGLTLKNQAYTLASYIRQAQTYTLAVRKVDNRFDISYGVYVDKNQPTQFIFFADRDSDDKYDAGEAVETKLIGDGVTIEKVCGSNSSGTAENCNTALVSTAITFVRPDPSSVVQILNNGGNPPSSVYPPARIHLLSKGGKSLVVMVDSTGQVSIQ